MHTYIIKVRRGKYMMDIPQGDCLASTDHNVVVCRGGQGHDEIGVLDDGADLLVGGRVPERDR